MLSFLIIYKIIDSRRPERFDREVCRSHVRLPEVIRPVWLLFCVLRRIRDQHNQNDCAGSWQLVFCRHSRRKAPRSARTSLAKIPLMRCLRRAGICKGSPSSELAAQSQVGPAVHALVSDTRPSLPAVDSRDVCWSPQGFEAALARGIRTWAAPAV